MKQHNPAQLRELKTAAQSLYRAITAMESPADVRRFLLDLCTPAELEALVDRWWVATLLDEGRSYRDISELTGVSVTTIGRVARFMDLGEGGYRIALQRQEKETS